MCYSEHAVKRLTDYIQRHGKDSEGNPVTTLKQADDIAARIINRLVSDQLISQIIQEEMDSERFAQVR